MPKTMWTTRSFAQLWEICNDFVIEKIRDWDWVTLQVYDAMRWPDEQTNRYSVGLNIWKIRALCFWSDNNIYFVSGRYGCSSVAVADAVADVAVATDPAFVACYHCHLPRSSYKHGASLKAPYPLLSQSFFLIQNEELCLGFDFTSGFAAVF